MRSRVPAVLAATLLGMLVLVAPAHATFPGKNGKVAFQSDRANPSVYDVFTMNRDGTNQTNLTNNLANDVYPSWSADGQKIAFQTNRDGNDEIYSMNADGTGP